MSSRVGNTTGVGLIVYTGTYDELQQKLRIRDDIITKLEQALDANVIWDELRKECCISKPYTDAKTIVQLHYSDVKNVMNKIRKDIL